MNNSSANRLALAFVLLFQIISANAQEFITPLEMGIAPSMHCYIIKANGERLEGKTRFAFTSGRGIKVISLMLPSGEVERFRANELKEIGFKNNDLTRVISSTEQLASVRKAAEADWDQIHQQEFIIYSTVTLPSGKQAMMQQINPGFDSRIKVYYSLGSRKTSGIGIPAPGPFVVKITGGRQRAYWVAKDDGKVIKLKRGNYNKKKFTLLFGDQPKMLTAFARPYRFNDFANHVFYYEQHAVR